MYTDAQQQQQLAEAYYAQAMSQKQHQLFQQQQEAAATAANAHMYYGHPPQQQQQFGDASANARGLSKAMPQPMYFQQNDAMAYAAYQQQHQQQQQQQAMYYQQAAASAAAGAMPVDTLPSPYVTAAQHKKYNTRSSQAAANAASGTGYYVRAQHQQQPMRVGGMVGVPPMAPHLAPVSAPPHTNMHNSMSTGTLASAGSSAGTVPTPPVFLAGASSAMVTPNSNSAGGYQTVDSVNAYMSDELGRSVANGTAPFSYGAPINDMPPWSPHAILAHQNKTLSPYERTEIVDYPQVYYFGQNAKEGTKRQATTELPENNFGYDDERGDYLWTIGDQMAYRYEVTDSLGKGSFGQVVKVFDHKTKTHSALKIIRNKKRFHHQALIEVKILQTLKERDFDDAAHIIKMQESFYFRGHLCISFELLSMNLYEFIKSNQFRGFSLSLIRRFAEQLLASMVLLQDLGIVHCDLKPENVLLVSPSKSRIKMIDFGSSCYENERLYTYIQSRFYRSPEVILGMEYGMPIDMWSLGCILAELLTGYPVFPGENEQEQLLCIMEIMGMPPANVLAKATRRKVFFDSNNAARIVPNSKGRKRRPGTKTLEGVLKCNDKVFLDFLRRCLTWDPEQRMTPREATQHRWITMQPEPIKSVISSISNMTVSAFGMAPPATQQQQQQPLPYSTNVVRQHDPMVLSSPQKTSYIGGPSEHAQPKASMKTRSHNNQQQQQQQGMQQHQVNQTYAQPVYTNSNFYYSAMNYGAPGAAARSNYQKLQETAEAAATAAPLKGARRGPRQYYTKNDNLPAIPGGSHVVQQQNAATPSSSGSGTSFLSVGGIAAKIVSGIGSLGKGSNGGSSGNRAWKK